MGRSFGMRPRAGVPPPPGSPIAKQFGCCCPSAYNGIAPTNDSGVAVWLIHPKCRIHGGKGVFTLPTPLPTPLRCPPPPKDTYAALRRHCRGYSRQELLGLDLRGESLSESLSMERHPEAYASGALLWEQEACAQAAERMPRRYRKEGRIEAAEVALELAKTIRARHPEPPAQRTPPKIPKLDIGEFPTKTLIQFTCPSSHAWIEEIFTTTQREIDLSAHRCPSCNERASIVESASPLEPWFQEFWSKGEDMRQGLLAFAESYRFGPESGQNIRITQWPKSSAWGVHAGTSCLTRGGHWVAYPSGQLPYSLRFDTPEEAYACLRYGQNEPCPVPLPEIALNIIRYPMEWAIPKGDSCCESSPSDTNENGEPKANPRICPYWSSRPTSPEDRMHLGNSDQEIIAFCAYLRQDDLDIRQAWGSSRLWNQTKECGIGRNYHWGRKDSES